MSDFKTTGWSYDPTCVKSPSGAHYWIVDVGNFGVCRHCRKKHHFVPVSTNKAPPSSRAYSIRGGESSKRVRNMRPKGSMEDLK